MRAFMHDDLASTSLGLGVGASASPGGGMSPAAAAESELTPEEEEEALMERLRHDELTQEDIDLFVAEEEDHTYYDENKKAQVCLRTQAQLYTSHAKYPRQPNLTACKIRT